MTGGDQQRITQHKRFVLYGTHPNSASGGTSFMLKPLGDILLGSFKNIERKRTE